MKIKVVWVLYLITGGALDATLPKDSPATKIPLSRFWTKKECAARVMAYDSPDGESKLQELAGNGQGYMLTCLSREVEVAESP